MAVTRKKSKVIQVPTLNRKMTIRMEATAIGPLPDAKSSELAASQLVKTLIRRKSALRRTAIFTNAKVNSFSVDPADPTKIVRESYSGKKSVGRMVDGKFRSLP
jgi:hypothetical protein